MKEYPITNNQAPENPQYSITKGFAGYPVLPAGDWNVVIGASLVLGYW